jgi:pimeloyl-ACP methyl ester carboxylesterase
MRKLILAAALISLLSFAGACASAPARAAADKPTIVLVHGAFAESSSWDGVASRLLRDGYPVVAAANPLRSASGDAAYVSAIVAAIDGPVVLVGHSYGGTVISAAANGRANVRALVFVSAFAPDEGETSFGLAGLYPGATLGETLAAPVPLADGGADLFIVQSRFRAQFAADVPPAQAALMAATQRPITAAAGNEPSPAPAWRSIPSYFIYGSEDLNIPPAALAFMAARARARHTVEVRGASHVVMISHPREVTALIEEAAAAASVAAGP